MSHKDLTVTSVKLYEEGLVVNTIHDVMESV